MKSENQKIVRVIIALTIVLAILLTSCTTKEIVQTQKLSKEQKLEDFRNMYDVLKETFPYFEVKKRMLNYDWLAHKDEFEEMIKTTETDSDFYNTMDRIITLIQSGHTHILDYNNLKYFKELYENPHSAYSPSRRNILSDEYVTEMYQYWNKTVEWDYYYIPILFRYVEGKYIVVDGNLDKYDIQVGSVLTEVDKVPVDDFVKTLNDKMYLEYDFKYNKQKATYLLIYTDNNKEVNLSLSTPQGEIKETKVKEGLFNHNVFGYEESDKNYDLKILQENKTAYIRLRSMSTKDRFSSAADGEEIYAFLNQIVDYPYLIIDIRQNGGGSSGYWRSNLVAFLIHRWTKIDSHITFKSSEYLMPFVKERSGGVLIKEIGEMPDNVNYPPELSSEFSHFYTEENGVVPHNPVKFNGKIYLLVDDNSYSSAEGFAIFAKATNFATLVGTATGGDGIGADAAMLKLPNSGLVLRYASVMGINPDGTANEETHTQPDVYLEQSFEDFYNLLLDTGKQEYIGTDYDTTLKYVLNEIKE